MKKILFISLAVMLALSVGIIGCTGQQEEEEEEEEEEEPIKIGGILEFTGSLAALGEACKNGALLAFEEAGYEVAGRPVEFILEDGASDTAITMDKARKLVEVDEVCMIIGPVHSGCAEGIADYIDNAKVPVMAIWGHGDSIPLEHDWFFLTAGTLRQGTYGMGVYAREQLGYETAATIGMDYVGAHEYIEGFVQAFEERGGEVIQQQWFPWGTTDFSPYILSVEEADCLVSFPTDTSGFLFYPQIKELGLEMPHIMLVSDALTSAQHLQEIGDSAIGMTTGNQYCYILDTPGNEEFVQNYQDKYGVLPDSGSASTYANVQVALAVLEATGGDTSPEALHEALSEITVDTLIYPVSYNPNGIAVITYYIFNVSEDLIPELVAEYHVGADVVGNEIVVSLEE